MPFSSPRQPDLAGQTAKWASNLEMGLFLLRELIGKVELLLESDEARVRAQRVKLGLDLEKN
jgi:hypothetical protein